MSGKPGRWENINDAIHDGDSQVFVEDSGTGEVSIVVDGTTVQSWLAGGTEFTGTITCEGIRLDENGNADIILSKNTDGEVEILTDNNRSFYADSYDAQIGDDNTFLKARFDGEEITSKVAGKEWLDVTASRVKFWDAAGGAMQLELNAQGIEVDGSGEFQGTLNVVSEATFEAGVVAEGGSIEVGVDDDTKGLISVFGHATGEVEGGEIRVYNSADDDTTQDFYAFKSSSGNLHIGPNNYPTAMQFVAADDEWEFKKTVYFDGNFHMSGVVEGSLGAQHTLSAGSLSTDYGRFHAYASVDGVDGGRLTLDTGNEHDTTIDGYTFRVHEDDLTIGPETDIDSLKYAGGTNDWHFTGAGGINIGVDDSVNASIKLHTTDGPAGDGFYIRTDANGVLEIGNDGTSGMKLTASSGPSQWSIFCIDSVEFGLTDELAGKIELLSGAAAQGPEIIMVVPPDHDTTIAHYLIDINEDDLTIGPNTNPDALKYNGSTNTWDFDAPIGSIDYIQFDTSYSNGVAVGRLQWDSSNGTLQYGLPGGNVNLQLGQEHVIKAKNNSGSPIPDGTPVYIHSTDQSFPQIRPADADSTDSIPEAVVMGVTTESINDGVTGYVTSSGMVRDFDTDHLTEGSPVWLSTTPGELTDVKPTAPNRAIFIGHCIKKNASTGSILVDIVPIPPMIGLSDVLPQALTLNGEFLSYNASNARFEIQDVTIFHDATDAIIKTDTVTPSDLVIVTGAEKTIELATPVWDDVVVPMAATKLGGANAASEIAYRGGLAAEFVDTADNYIYMTIQLPHSYKEGTDIELHLHWTVSGDGGEVGVENISWIATSSASSPTLLGSESWPGETTHAEVIVDVQDYDQHEHYATDIAHITGTNFKASECIIISFKRNSGVANNSTLHAIVVSADCHFLKDTIGSRQEYVK